MQMYFHIPHMEKILRYSSLYQMLFFFSYHLQIGVELHLYATWYEGSAQPMASHKGPGYTVWTEQPRADRTTGIVAG